MTLTHYCDYIDKGQHLFTFTDKCEMFQSQGLYIQPDKQFLSLNQILLDDKLLKLLTVGLTFVLHMNIIVMKISFCMKLVYPIENASFAVFFTE